MKDRMRFLLKLGLACGLTWLGVNRLFRYLNRRKVKILLYHGIVTGRLPETLNSESLHLPREAFAKQLAYLKRWYHPLSLDEFVRRVHAHEPLPDYTVVITFDDGYLNNYQHAWPLLKSLGIPATLCVTTSFLSSDELLWLDALEYSLHATRQPRLRVTLDGHLQEFSLRGLRAKRSSLRRVKRLLKRQAIGERRALLDGLQAQLGVRPRVDDLPHCAPLSWEGLAEMHRDGTVAIGSHAVQHDNLDTMTLAAAREQLAQSKALLEARLKTRVTAFAYPGGACTEELKRLARDAGYQCALATRHGFNDATTDLFELRRNEVGSAGNLWCFKATVSGAFDGIKSLLRR